MKKPNTMAAISCPWVFIGFSSLFEIWIFPILIKTSNKMPREKNIGDENKMSKKKINTNSKIKKTYNNKMSNEKNVDSDSENDDRCAESQDGNNFPCYDTESYIDFGIKQGFFQKNTDVQNFRLGHFEGIDAIKCFVKCKFTKQTQNAPKNLKSVTIPIIIEKMKNGSYDGMSITNIIYSEKKNLGESLIIQDSLSNSGEQIFSFDRKYSLPLYQKTNIELNEEEKNVMSYLWKENKFNLRSRADFIHYFKEKLDDFDISKIDSALQYLVDNFIKNR